MNVIYVYIPIVQRECNTFVDYWNSHRIRAQEKLEIPTGIPNHMFSFPENYGATNKGICLSEEDINEVADVSGVIATRMHALKKSQGNNRAIYTTGGPVQCVVSYRDQ